MKRSFDLNGEMRDDSNGSLGGVDSQASVRLREGDSVGEENAENTSVDAEQKRRRELNRLSKIRCRQRRKDLVRDLEAKIACLSEEYHVLQAENQQLRQEFALWTSPCPSGQGGVIQNSEQTNLSMLQSIAVQDSGSASTLLQCLGTFDHSTTPWNRQQEVVLANPTFSVASVQNSGIVTPAGQMPQPQDFGLLPKRQRFN